MRARFGRPSSGGRCERRVDLPQEDQRAGSARAPDTAARRRLWRPARRPQPARLSRRAWPRTPHRRAEPRSNSSSGASPSHRSRDLWRRNTHAAPASFPPRRDTAPTPSRRASRSARIRAIERFASATSAHYPPLSRRRQAMSNRRYMQRSLRSAFSRYFSWQLPHAVTTASAASSILSWSFDCAALYATIPAARSP